MLKTMKVTLICGIYYTYFDSFKYRENLGSIYLPKLLIKK